LIARGDAYGNKHTGRRKPKKNLIEKRAIPLADSIKRKWLAKSKDTTKRNIQQPVLLSITDVISIAVPIIEEFAKEPITFRKRGSDSDPPSFAALHAIVCAYARGGAGCNKLTVNRLLKRVRVERDAKIEREDSERLRICIAPELRSWLQ
jgi:hypothetical protein